MSEQPLDLQRSWHILRRHLVAVFMVGTVGLLAGAGYMIIKPPVLTSDALVVVSATTANATATQVVVAGSDAVLGSALRHADPPMSLSALQDRIAVKSVAPGVISIAASGQNATEAEHTADAVADSYVAYLSGQSNASGDVRGRLLEPATSATGPSRPVRIAVAALLGALAGTFVGAFSVLVLGRRERRLRLRDQIADAIGVPVLASLPVSRPTDAAQWSRLLEDYQPSPATAWRLRSALRYLGLPDVMSTQAAAGDPRSLSVISLSSDRRSLALGPQLAVFAAAQGVATDLIIGPQRDSSSTAALRAACEGPPSSRRPTSLRVAVANDARIVRWPDSLLTIVVTVVDDRPPRLDDALRTDVAVLAVSPGSATADLLAAVAASAAANGCQIAGLLIANPDPADPTTGRIPQMVRPARPTQLTRAPGTPSRGRRARESTR